MRTRYLEPVHGRFIMLDTVGIWTDSLARGNGYAFAAMQPFTSGDPEGTLTVNVKATVQAFSQERRDLLMRFFAHTHGPARSIKNAADWIANPYWFVKKRRRYYQTDSFEEFFGDIQDRWQFWNVIRRARKFERYLRKGTINIKYRGTWKRCEDEDVAAWTTRGATTIRLCEGFFTRMRSNAVQASTLYHEVSHMRGHTADFASIKEKEWSERAEAAKGLATRHPRTAKRTSYNWQFLFLDPKCREEDQCQ